MAKRSTDTVKPVPRTHRKGKSPQYESMQRMVQNLVGKIHLPQRAIKNGNGLYPEMKAIVGTMPHRKSEPRIHKVVPKLAVRVSD